MLTVTVRFYITAGGITTALLILLRISFTLGALKSTIEQKFKRVDDKFRNVETKFGEQDADIRELRSMRKVR